MVATPAFLALAPFVLRVVVILAQDIGQTQELLEPLIRLAIKILKTIESAVLLAATKYLLDMAVTTAPARTPDTVTAINQACTLCHLKLGSSKCLTPNLLASNP